MRWSSVRKPKPKFGQTRVFKCFAILPTEVEGEMIVWLETFLSIEEYSENGRWKLLYNFSNDVSVTMARNLVGTPDCRDEDWTL